MGFYKRRYGQEEHGSASLDPREASRTAMMKSDPRWVTFYVEALAVGMNDAEAQAHATNLFKATVAAASGTPPPPPPSGTPGVAPPTFTVVDAPVLTASQQVQVRETRDRDAFEKRVRAQETRDRDAFEKRQAAREKRSETRDRDAFEKRQAAREVAQRPPPIWETMTLPSEIPEKSALLPIVIGAGGGFLFGGPLGGLLGAIGGFTFRPGGLFGPPKTAQDVWR